MEDTGLYQNGITAQQFNCRLSLENDHLLHIYLDNEKSDLLIWDIRNLQSCHLNGTSLIIKYGAYPHQTLECKGHIADSIYRAWSQRHIIRRAEGFTFKKRTAAVLIFTALFIILSCFALFYLIPWIGEKAANLVPIATEEQLGESIASIYTQENNMNDSAGYYVNEFVKNLKLDDTYSINVQVINSKEINAFAVPGGRIFVYSGILKQMNSYEELVALLGHEVTHVVNRHSLKSICRSAATGIVVASVFGDITGISSGVISQAEQFKQLDYSRDLETEADVNGVAIMVQNKIDPKGMLDLLELLKKESAEMPYLMKYLSTHPDTDSRIKTVSGDLHAKDRFAENETLAHLFEKIKEKVDKE